MDIILIGEKCTSLYSFLSLNDNTSTKRLTELYEDTICDIAIELVIIHLKFNTFGYRVILI